MDEEPLAIATTTQKFALAETNRKKRELAYTGMTAICLSFCAVLATFFSIFIRAFSHSFGMLMAAQESLTVPYMQIWGTVFVSNLPFALGLCVFMYLIDRSCDETFSEWRKINVLARNFVSACGSGFFIVAIATLYYHFPPEVILWSAPLLGFFGMIVGTLFGVQNLVSTRPIPVRHLGGAAFESFNQIASTKVDSNVPFLGNEKSPDSPPADT